MVSKRILSLIFVLAPLVGMPARAQTTIPYEYRGNYEWVARGVMDGNLIETNYRNHGELSRWQDIPQAVWPRTIGGSHSDGTALVIAGKVRAVRPAKYYTRTTDTTVTPVAINFRTAGVRRSPKNGELWTFLPLNNFLNPDRRNKVTGRFERIPAISDDSDSWPSFWPDKLDNPDDPGWSGSWNGLFGKGVFNADLESFYVIDDLSNKGYHIDTENDEPYSPYGIYYADPADSSIGGLGIQVEVRLLQWANILAEDVMFMLYRINNVGGTDHDSLYFTHQTDYGLGENDENDDNASFDPQLDVAYGWDSDGIGTRSTGGEFTVGVMGFAFLESPAAPFDGLDNDEDGIIDERRDSGAGMLIEGQENIRAYMEANYNIDDFERVYGPIEELPAYKAGRWWTGDENANWTSYDDVNGNGKADPGEFLNDDSGIDGLTPNDYGYVEADYGEADGIPQEGERDFDKLDIPESDQIGLRGFHLGIRATYENVVLHEDHLIWQQIIENEFELGTEPPTQSLTENEPFILFLSGPVTLPPGTSDYFSLAWIFGQTGSGGNVAEDFFKNRITVQNIYDANYNFAQPPILPTLTAVPGDGRVVLGWDSVSIASFDRFLQEKDFEGYKLYRGTDPLLFDVKTITDVDGVPTFYKPIAQWDLIDGKKGTVPVLDNTASFNLGDDTGLQFHYVDEDVTNGVTYYYALNAYDYGSIDSSGVTKIDPQETVFNIGVDAYYNVTGTSSNAQVVVPRSAPAGFVTAGTEDDLSRITSGIGSGSMSIQIVDEEEVRYGDTYRVIFSDSAETSLSPAYYATKGYTLVNMSTGDTLLKRPMEESSPVAEGFIMEFSNDVKTGYDFNRIGWVGNYGEENEMFNQDPRQVDGSSTTWITSVSLDDSENAELSPDDYELRWADEDIYYPPRFQTSLYLRDSINVVSYNLTTGEPTELLIVDRNENDEFDVADELIIMEQKGPVRKFRHRISFRIPTGSENIAPGDGEVYRISNYKPFAEGDFFQFTLSDSRIDAERARDELADVAVVPNPYLGYSIFEPRLSEATTGRGERVVRFINLPEQCTIRIFNVRGELIQTLHHDAVGSNNGSLSWDLRTKDGLDLAFGVYVYHVEAPGIGETVGKLAIVK